MLSDVPQSQLWIPRYPQPGKHDIPAMIRGMREAIQRIPENYPLAYSVGDRAPESSAELEATATSRLVVLGPYSDHTIFGEASVNHIQRAFHDTLHLKLDAGTDRLGEYRVAMAQAQEVARVSGDILADWQFVDLWGEVLHMVKYGVFPIDQVAFAHRFITTGQVERF